MYIRCKKIRNHDYAYLVEGTWDSKRGVSRQKFLKYLGRVHDAARVKEMSFNEFIGNEDIASYMDGKPYKDVISDLVRYEMGIHGLEEMGEKVFRMNEGFLCSYTIDALLAMEHLRMEECRMPEVEFAKLFLAAGLSRNDEVVVHLFEKLLHTKEMSFTDFSDKVGY